MQIVATTLGLSLGACTGQLENSFRLAQQEEIFNTTLDVNTKVDLLFVIDNSASMDNTQDKLRQGFAGFARRYLQPSWDMRVAVITTDTYLADSAFTNYKNGLVTSPGRTSAYINSRLATWNNPVSNPSLYDKVGRTFPNGVKYSEAVPGWNNNWSLLRAGVHDGPTTALCYEGLIYFLDGATNCRRRDDQNLLGNTGMGNCLNPNPALGESAVTHCVNTLQNDTIHSGRAIIASKPLPGQIADNNYTQKMIDDFTINVTTGTVGHGSERGLGSVLQLLKDNEVTPTAFFRQGSLRGIIFVSDEEDQTLTVPATPGPTFGTWTNYACDMAGIAAMNPGRNTDVPGGYCCASGCVFGAFGTTCPAKTIGTLTYTPYICPVAALLIPVTSIKATLDSFFRGLDGSGSTIANYFVVSIVPLDAAAITALQATRDVTDAAVGAIRTTTVDRGDRYLELGTLVGNGSLSMNIADPDYSPILDAIGQGIANKTGTFTLQRSPTGEEDMIVTILHGDGTSSVVPSSKYVISGKQLRITDLNVILSFSASDRISINYQPKTLFG